MRFSIFFFLCLLCFCINQSFAQDVYNRNQSADILDYVFSLTLNDYNNRIEGSTDITVKFQKNVSTFSLDLMGKDAEYGMEIIGIYENEQEVNYSFSNDKILITPRENAVDTIIYTINYHGIPEKGLVIDTTKFGNRSFFGDNWPNLARHWLPCVDHPYDKASVEFKITAPDHYDVLATGRKIEESHLEDGFKLTTYREPAPVAMKVVTIGVTQFASKLLGVVEDIPITAWVYPQNRLEGFSDYSVASNVMEYYIKNIGPYPYAKLANMQAKTQWGGLENAGTISYFENSVTGKNTVEALIAHEVAHQWFGNSATENSWNHVWLSEGFATYFTILYLESKYGHEKRKEKLISDRQRVIAYYQKNPSPVVDNSIKDPRKVLSTNTYQKGSWVLNMLRHKLGDDVFWSGIRNYYKKYRDSNVMTIDFRNVMEEVSGVELQEFFDQWIFTAGYPELKWNWQYQNEKLVVSIEQIQSHFVFKFPIEIGIKIGDAELIESLYMNSRSEKFEFIIDQKPEGVVLDPEVWLLHEEKM